MREAMDVIITDYLGPQGSFEVEMVESAQIEWTAPINRVATMNSGRATLAFQTGVEDPSASLTYIPEKLNREINWFRAARLKEVFQLTFEEGIGGESRLIAKTCRVESISTSASAEGDARKEVSIKIGKLTEEAEVETS